MKTNLLITKWLRVLTFSIISLQLSTVFAQDTAFTYQGQLNNNGSPANGLYDLRFMVWDAPTNGNLVAGPTTNSATGVTNGLFAVTLDFGSGVFTGPARWLELDVETNGSGAFTTLFPFQPLLPMPYAIMANSASNLLGTLPVAQLSAGMANINISGNAATATTATSAASATTATTANNFSGSLAGNVTGTQGATVVLTVGGQTAANVASGVIVANAATSANTASTIVKRDSSGNFSAGSVTLGGVLNLPATTASAGIIYSGGSTLMHSFGSENFFAGSYAGNLTMSGGYNMGIGFGSLNHNTSGFYNTANGCGALQSNTTGNYNTANGSQTLLLNTTGSDNTANGSGVLNANTGSGNTGNGSGALTSNTTGNYNTANGYAALTYNKSGNDNEANGWAALWSNLTGSYNTANGVWAIYGNTTGNNNTAEGYLSLGNNTNGNNNIALGYQAGYNVTTVSYNIDIGNMGLSTDNNIIRIGTSQTATYIAGVINGNGAGLNNLNASQLTSIGNTDGGSANFFIGPSGNSTTSGSYNTANGFYALYHNTSGSQNTANGYYTLVDNTTGSYNTANGDGALFQNTTGWGNTGNGVSALQNNTTGECNTANGYQALFGNTGSESGDLNTANGYEALYFNAIGSYNAANGSFALMNNTNGSANTADGVSALQQNTSGSENTAVGVNALFYNTNGSYNIALDFDAGFYITTGSNNIDIGNTGVSTDTNIIRIGTTQTATYLAGDVYGNSFNSTSDRNAKENFTAVNAREVLAKVASLPVTEWNFKTDSKDVQHIGPMAQDFQAAFQLGTDDKHISVVDEGGVALAAIQGLNQKLQEELNRQAAENAKLKQQNDSLEERLNELEATVKQLAANK